MHWHADIYQPVAHLAWEKGVCHGRAAFHITFQHKTTLSLKNRNRLMNFDNVAKALYQQYFLIQAAALVFCTECSETQVATSSLIN